MNLANIIAIDGPAASGKSTIGEQLAKDFGYLFFDTGMMYRALTWYILDQKLDIHAEATISVFAEELHIDVQKPSKDDGRSYDILLNGKDITWDIRSHEVDAFVSIISAYPEVRRALSKKQRIIGMRGKVVMVGRDIGTVVLPEADLKIYLEASVETRAKRRYDEIIKRGNHSSFEDILISMRKRDKIDSTRSVAPLRPAQGAIIINTDNLSITEVVEKIKRLAETNSVL